MTDQPAGPTADDYVRATAEAVGVDPDEAVAYRERTEHHTGTLNLTGEGNEAEHRRAILAERVIREHEPRPFGCVCGAQIGDDIDRRWHLVNAALEAAYPAIRQQVAEEIAAALAVSRSRITPGRPGWGYFGEAIDIAKRIGGGA